MFNNDNSEYIFWVAIIIVAIIVLTIFRPQGTSLNIKAEEFSGQQQSYHNEYDITQGEIGIVDIDH